MQISVIICSYNREKYIYNILKSVAEGRNEGIDYEIVFVNNNSVDETLCEVERFKNDYPGVILRSFNEVNQGLSFARNRGIREAEGEILVFTDDDATVNSDYLYAYKTFFETHPDVFAAGGPIIPLYETGEEPVWMTFFIKRLLTGYLYFGDKEKKFPGENYPGGGNAAYRKEVFEQVGTYDVTLGRNGGSLAGGEEKDIFHKMKKIGMKFWYIPDAVLFHSIPDYKLQEEYFTRLTLSIGQSERIRTRNSGGVAYLKRLLSEVIKWCATLLLWCRYFLSGKIKQGDKLVHFRKNVTKGLLAIK